LTFQGWIAVLGWQVGLASLCFIVGTVIQGLIVLDNLDTYIFERWHGTLLVMAIVAFCITFNSFLAKKLPFVESMVLIIHLLGFFGVLIPLWVLAPRSSASSVFTGIYQFRRLADKRPCFHGRPLDSSLHPTRR
jgi:choline transport protein